MSRFIERGLRDSVVGDAPLLEGGLALWPLGNCAFAWMNSSLKRALLIKGPLYWWWRLSSTASLVFR